MISATINQYRLARGEVEQQIASARAQGDPELSPNVVEDIIASNQRQTVSTLVEMVVAVRSSLQCSRNAVTARYLLNGCALWQLYDLFEPSARRLYGLLHEALDTIRTALDIQRRFGTNVESQQDSEDSQDLKKEEMADWTPTQDRKGKGKAVDVQEGISKYMNVLFPKY